MYAYELEQSAINALILVLPLNPCSPLQVLFLRTHSK